MAIAQPAASTDPAPNPSPGEIVAAAPREAWVAIAASDMLVMDLAPDAAGKPRRVVIQLMPAQFSAGWVSNIRKLAAANWWDGTAIVRVQDNYVVQWGDPDGEDEAKAKPLPDGIAQIPESDYLTVRDREATTWLPAANGSYAPHHGMMAGWPIAWNADHAWPVHCYGMVGVGRNLSPDTGSGAELYTVIGHAPRHLDRNIALVGRVIDGIEHLSSLPRGTGPLGFYEAAEDRTVIRAVRLATDLPPAEQPRFEYLDSKSESFARYADARANRRDAFFNIPAGGADICNIPVTIRKITQ
ncbi:peptidylprolyl isomerase [Blastomonas sp.]|uniref:peptidylprolyl isomerase n=1 Tax=Blastomonas sp. TaxID=1909299 RepID=UPI003594854A